MKAVRQFFMERKAAALVLLLAALALKMLLPPGTMIAGQDRVLTVTVCAESTGTQVVHAVTVPGKPQPVADPDGGTCGFSSLGAGLANGADALLLAAAIAFVMLRGLAPAPRPAPRPTGHLRPPLRGPPAAA